MADDVEAELEGPEALQIAKEDILLSKMEQERERWVRQHMYLLMLLLLRSHIRAAFCLAAQRSYDRCYLFCQGRVRRLFYQTHDEKGEGSDLFLGGTGRECVDNQESRAWVHTHTHEN